MPISSQFILREQLYDRLGRPAVSTVGVKKGTGNAALTPGFVSSFILGRDPDDIAPGSFWDGGVMKGDITHWLDSRNFPTTADQGYPYAGSYYEADSLSRPLQASGPGAAFSKTTANNHATTYQYGHFSGGSSNLTALLDRLSFTSVTLGRRYQTQAQKNYRGKLGTLSQGSIQTASGAATAHFLEDQSGNSGYRLTTQTTASGAQLSAYPDYFGQAPILLKQITYLPNTYTNTYPGGSVDFLVEIQSNALGQVVLRQASDSDYSVFFHDPYGRLRFSEKALQVDKNDGGVLIYYLYDALNRLTEIGYVNGNWNLERLRAQTVGPTTTRPTHGVPLRQLIYDKLPDSVFNPTHQGRLLQIRNWNAAVNETARTITRQEDSQITETYTYDDQGRITAVTTQLINDTAYTTQYTYHSTGNINTITYPQGSLYTTIAHRYNLQGQLQSIGQDKNSAYYAAYQYDAGGQLTSESLANASGRSPLIRRYLYGNPLRQLTDLQDSGGFLQETLIYTDGASNTSGTYQDGNIQSIAFKMTDDSLLNNLKTKNAVLNYAYDAFSRLAAVKGGHADVSNVSYDANGNLLTITRNGNNQKYGYYIGTNRISLVNDPYPAYNASGFMLQTADKKLFTYDLLSALPVQINLPNGKSVRLIYDSRGERYQKQSATRTTYIRGLGANPLTEYGSSANASYLYGASGLLHMTDSRVNMGAFILKDHLGSTRMLLQDQPDIALAAYYAYDSFGSLIEKNSKTGWDICRYLYTGQEWDEELGLYNYHARQYDPQLVRFLTPDPAHQFASPYVYVANNPINAIDPTGKSIWDLWEGFLNMIGFNREQQPLREGNFIEDRRGRPHAESIALGGKNEEWNANSLTGVYRGLQEGITFMDPSASALFRTSNENVAFVGIYRTTERKVYLYPLSRNWIDRVTTRQTTGLKILIARDEEKIYERNQNFNRWQDVANQNIYIPENAPKDNQNNLTSIVHKVSDSTSHRQLAEMYNIPVTKDGQYFDDAIGFSIVKRKGDFLSPHEFNAQSQTINQNRFRYSSIDRSQSRGVDAYVTKEWSTALMKILSKEL